MNVTQEYGRIVIHEDGAVFRCGDCNFLYLLNQGCLIRPIKDTAQPYLCPLCRKVEPRLINIRVLVPRVGLECEACKKVLCIWEGSARTDEFANSSFKVDEWVPGVKPYTDPLKEAVQSALVSVFLDALPVPLNAAVEVIAAQLDASGLLSKIRINRIKRARVEEAAKPKPEKKKRKKREKKKPKKKKEKTEAKADPKTKVGVEEGKPSKDTHDRDDSSDT
jgi:hypothetical protein